MGSRAIDIDNSTTVLAQKVTMYSTVEIVS